MTQQQPEARAVALSTRIYAAMLRAYPAAFRAEYAEPMAQLFRDNCRAVYRTGGPVALLILWPHILADYIRTTIEEYASGGIQMTRETFLKLSGWALLIGALTLMAGWLASSRPEYDPYNALSVGIDRYANAAADFLIALGFLLVSLGVAGLLARYGKVVGQTARVALWISVVSGLIAATGVVIGALGIADEITWPMMMFGMAFMFTGLLVFGLDCLQRDLMPRWNKLPFLAAIWIPSWLLFSVLYETLTGSYLDLPAAASAILLLIPFGGLALLGVMMLTEDSAPASTPAV